MQDAAGTAPDSEDDWEYEYDETETETFYVNIDLTSHNGVSRQARRGAPSTAAATTDEQEAEDAPSPATEDGMQNADEENGDATEADHLENNNVDDRIQIMELHGKNPFVSYHSNIFSCEWADMIGTDMHFAKHRDDDASEPDPTYLKRADDYSLIAANPIKIIGRRTRLVPAAIGASAGVNESVKRPEEKPQQQPDGISAQVRFLQELMDIKREKGETDMLQMTFGTRRGKNFEGKLSAWGRSDERVDLVHQLNRAALAGDQSALAKLEELYEHIEAGAEDFKINSTADMAPTDAAPTTATPAADTAPAPAPSG